MNVKNRKKHVIAIILSIVLVIETFFFSIANATRVANWGVLAGMLFDRLTKPITIVITSQFAGLIAYMKRMSNLPGILKEFPVSSYQKMLEDIYRESYWKTVHETGQAVQTPADWIDLVEKGEVIPPVVMGKAVLGNFSKYAGYVSGDMKVIYEALNSLENNGEIDEVTKTHVLVKARELDAVKTALTQKIADNSASSAVLSKMVNDLGELYKKIDASMKSKDYKKEQAMKDIVKVQSLNIRITNEIIRRMINQRATSVAIVNYDLNKKRNELINDLQVLHTKVEGSWTLK